MACNTVVSTALVTAVAVIVLGAASNDTDCSIRLPKYYHELGCIPVTPLDSLCPTSFDCSSLLSRDHSKCYYKGVAYDSKQARVDIKKTDPCLAECRCQEHVPGRATFVCVTADCPESFEPQLKKGCVRKHSLDRCCSTGTYCKDDSNQEEPFLCEYGNSTYQEGQYMDIPERPCLTCICQEGFNGTLTEPWCRDQNCNLELHDAGMILGGCAPIFYGDEVCCPVDWRCPVSSDTVIPHSSLEGNVTVTDAQCQFGNLTLNAGDDLSPADNPCVTCSCSMPPHVSCQQKPHGECSS